MNKEEIKKGKVLLQFSATWCGHCVAMEPVMEEIREKYKGSIKICKIDIDEDKEFAKEYKVSSVPTFILLNDGVIEKQKIGAMNLNAMKEFLE